MRRTVAGIWDVPLEGVTPALAVTAVCFFLGGVALGSLGAVALGRGELDFRPLAAGLLSRGLDVKDAVAEKAELIKENAEDLAAEARHLADRRKEARSADAEAAAN